MIHPRMSLADAEGLSETARVNWVLSRLPVGETVTAREIAVVYGFHAGTVGKVLKTSPRVRPVGTVTRYSGTVGVYEAPRYEVVG